MRGRKPVGDPQEMLRLHLQGLSNAEIGQQFGISRQAVAKKLGQFPEYRAGLREKQRIDLVTEAASRCHYVLDIARETELSHSQVTRILKQQGIKPLPLTPQFSRRSLPEIGEVFGSWKVIDYLGYRSADRQTYSFNLAGMQNSTYYIQTRCIECDQEFPVQLRFLIEGRSKSCQKCSAKLRKQKLKAD